METFILISNIFVFALFLAAPVFLLLLLKKHKTKRITLFYFLSGFIVLCGLMLIYAWWAQESNLILLKHYGYNIDGMIEAEFYGKVLPENRERVNSLETSVMGIGWPLKAMFGSVLIIPYLILVFFGEKFVRRLRKEFN